MINAEDLRPGSSYLAALPEPLINPHRDRRVKRDWTGLPTFAAGRVYTLHVWRPARTDEAIVEVSRVGYHATQSIPLRLRKDPDGRLRLTPHETLSPKAGALLIEHLRLVEPTVMERVLLVERYHAVDLRDLLEVLVEGGVLTHDVLSMALHAVQERYAREAAAEREEPLDRPDH